MLMSIVLLSAIIAIEVGLLKARLTNIFLLYCCSELAAFGLLTGVYFTPLKPMLDTLLFNPAGFDRFFSAHILCMWAAYSLFRLIPDRDTAPASRDGITPGEANLFFSGAFFFCLCFLAVYVAAKAGSIAGSIGGIGTDSGATAGYAASESDVVDRIGIIVIWITASLVGLVNLPPGWKWCKAVCLALLFACFLRSRGLLVVGAIQLYFSLRLYEKFKLWHLLPAFALLAIVAVIRGASEFGFAGSFLLKFFGNVASDSYIFDHVYWAKGYVSRAFFSHDRFFGRYLFGESFSDADPPEFYVPVIGFLPWNTNSALGMFLFNYSPAPILAWSALVGGMLRIFDIAARRVSLAWCLKPFLAVCALLAPTQFVLSSPQFLLGLITVSLLWTFGRYRLATAILVPSGKQFRPASII